MAVPKNPRPWNVRKDPSIPLPETLFKTIGIVERFCRSGNLSGRRVLTTRPIRSLQRSGHDHLNLILRRCQFSLARRAGGGVACGNPGVPDLVHLGKARHIGQPDLRRQDAGFVAVTGGSAGGHLAALMGLTANRPELQPDNPGIDTTVQACIPFYGIYDFLVRYDQHPNRQAYERFLTGKVLHESVQDNPALWDLASPVAQIHADAPPFMIVHGTHDSLAAVAEGRVFSAKLRGVSRQPVVYVEMPGAEHPSVSV